MYRTVARPSDFFFFFLKDASCKMNCTSVQLEKQPQMLAASSSWFHLHSNTWFHFQKRCVSIKTCFRLLAPTLYQSATVHLHHCHLLDLTVIAPSQLDLFRKIELAK